MSALKITTYEINNVYPLASGVAIYALILISCISGQNFLSINGYHFSAGIFIYQINFIIVAALAEVYGYRCARTVIMTVCIFNLFTAALFALFAYIPFENAHIANIEYFREFQRKLALLVFLSSFPYLVADNINAYLISKLKIMIGGRLLLLRGLIATSIAIIVDTWLVWPIFLYEHHGSIAKTIIETSIVTGIKIAYEIFLLPLLWLLVVYIRKTENDHITKNAELYSSTNYVTD